MLLPPPLFSCRSQAATEGQCSAIAGSSGSAANREEDDREVAARVVALLLSRLRIRKQASGAVTLTRGESALYATASRGDEPRDVDFLQPSVDH